MSEWQQTTLGAFCDEGKASIQTGPFGSQLHSHDYLPYGIPVIPTSAVDLRRLDHSQLVYVSSEKVSELKRHIVQNGDILFARRGAKATGLSAIVTATEEGWLAGTGIIRVRFQSRDLLPEFVSMYLSSPHILEWIQFHALGTTMPNLNQSILRQLPLVIPPLDEQREIAHILGALDDKIELNRRMNATLEEMARALFQSWFVDFDPVRAKAEGRQPEGMDAETAALFPDGFEESALGIIPRGWGVGTLGDVALAIRGFSYKGSGLTDSDNGLPMHNLNSVYEGGGYKSVGMKYYLGDFQKRHLAYAGDLIVTNTEQGHEHRLIGYPALIPSKYPEALFSHHLYRVVPTEGSPLSTRYLYFLLRTSVFHETVAGYSNGTTVNMLPIDGLQRPELVIPPKEVVSQFDHVVVAMLEKMEALEAESLVLAETRDSLLPRLVSGELRVGKARRVKHAKKNTHIALYLVKPKKKQKPMRKRGMVARAWRG